IVVPPREIKYRKEFPPPASWLSPATRLSPRRRDRVRRGDCPSFLKVSNRQKHRSDWLIFVLDIADRKPRDSGRVAPSPYWVACLQNNRNCETRPCPWLAPPSFPLFPRRDFFLSK